VGIQHHVTHAIPEVTKDSAGALGGCIIPDFLRKASKGINNHDAGNAASQAGTYPRHDFVCTRAADGSYHPGLSSNATRE
jgi:hypothetical protein